MVETVRAELRWHGAVPAGATRLLAAQPRQLDEPVARVTASETDDIDKTMSLLLGSAPKAVDARDLVAVESESEDVEVGGNPSWVG
jgi:hypothetical protein